MPNIRAKREPAVAADHSERPDHTAGFDLAQLPDFTVQREHAVGPDYVENGSRTGWRCQTAL